MPCATSTRKPSTPRSSQNRRTSSNSARTSGCSQFRSGCRESNRCRYHWPSGEPGPGRRRRRSTPSCSGAARRRDRGRRGTGTGRAPASPAPTASASWNQTCSSEVWLGTRSTMTRRPRPWARGEQRVEVVERAEQRVDLRGSRRRRSRRRPAASGRTARARRRRRPSSARCVEARRDAGQVADAVARARPRTSAGTPGRSRRRATTRRRGSRRRGRRWSSGASRSSVMRAGLTSGSVGGAGESASRARHGPVRIRVRRGRAASRWPRARPVRHPWTRGR